jgi:hypothetical protein
MPYYVQMDEPASTEMSEEDDCDGGSPDLEKGDCFMAVHSQKFNVKCSASKLDMIEQSLLDDLTNSSKSRPQFYHKYVSEDHF